MPDVSRILDFLRRNFANVVAVGLPLAGVVLAVVKLIEGDREEAARIVAFSVLGLCLYALALT